MKAQLLRLMENEDREKAIEAVLQSGLLPESHLQQFLDNLTKRVIYFELRGGCYSAWRPWITNWLSGVNRIAAAPIVAPLDAVQIAAYVVHLSEHTVLSRRPSPKVAKWVRAAADTARAAELKAQYDDLLTLINEMKDENN